MNSLDPVFRMVLTASAQAAAIAGVVVVLQVTIGRRLGVRWQYALWLVVLARLLMPWTPGSAVSVWNVAERLLAAEAAPVPVVAPALEALPDVSLDAPIVVAEPFDLPAMAPMPAKPEPLSAADVARWVAGHAGVLWMAGALGVFSAIVLRAAVFARRMRSARPVEGERIERILADCRARISVRKAPRVFETPLVPVPVLFGLARPRIILPEGLAARLSDRELAFVLLHELAHVRRHDLAMNWLMALAQCAHWFNPFIWVALARMRADREMAADALVVESARPGEALDYGRTLVSLLEGLARRRPAFVALGILERRSRLKRRIAMIADYKPGTVRTTLLGVIALVALAVATLTAAEEQTPQPAPSAGAALEGYVLAQASNESADGLSAAQRAEIEKRTKEREAAFEEARRLSRSPAGQREAQARLKAVRLESTAARARADSLGVRVEDLPSFMLHFYVTPEQVEMDIAYLTGLLAEISARREGGPSGQALMEVREKLPPVISEIDRAAKWIAYAMETSDENQRKQAESLKPLHDSAVKLLAMVKDRLRAIGSNVIGQQESDARRRQASPQPAPAPETPESQEVRRKLEKRIPEFAFVGQTLGQALNYLSSACDVKIVTSPSVSKVHRVTHALYDASAAAVLDSLTARAGRRWAVVDGYAYVATVDEVLARGGTPENAAYDLWQLGQPVVDAWVRPQDIIVQTGKEGRHKLLVTIRTGGRGTMLSKVRLYDGDPAEGGATLVDRPLDAYAGEAAVIVLDLPGSFGEHKIVVDIDPDGSLPETNEDNNTASAVVTFAAPAEEPPAKETPKD